MCKYIRVVWLAEIIKTISLAELESGKRSLKKFVFMNIVPAALCYFSVTSASSQEISAIVSEAQFAFDQQALFQEADKNADRVITSNEIPISKFQKSDKKLESQFNELDTDLSGSLSKDEILAAHEKIGTEYLEVQKSRRGSLINKFDLNSNGEISSYEIDHVQARLEYELSELRNSSKDLQSAILGIGERYKTLLDTDSDGSVSKDEILKHIENISERKRKILKRQSDKLIKQFDLDNNGTISPTEIGQVEYYSEEKMIESRRALADRDFKYKDSDNNNVVSLEEYKYSHQRPGSARDKLLEKGTFISRDINDDSKIHYTENEEFIKLLFKTLDVDNNGQLSVKEQKTVTFKKFQKIAFSKLRISQ